MYQLQFQMICDRDYHLMVVNFQRPGIILKITFLMQLTRLKIKCIYQ